MIEASRKADRILAMVSQRRFFPPVQRLRRAVDEGKLGVPALCVVTVLGWRDEEYYASDSWRGSWKTEGGGVLINQASHMLDLMQWFLGPIERVAGYTSNINHPYIDVEDTAVAVVSATGGSLGVVVASNSQNPGLFGKVILTGSNGSSVGIQTDGGSMFLPGRSGMSEAPRIDFWNIPGEDQFLETWNAEDEKIFQSSEPTVYFHALQMEDFLTAITQGTKPLVSGEEGRRSVQIFETVYNAARSNVDSGKGTRR